MTEEQEGGRYITGDWAAEALCVCKPHHQLTLKLANALAVPLRIDSRTAKAPESFEVSFWCGLQTHHAETQWNS
jgi:hypothetical protein